MDKTQKILLFGGLGVGAFLLYRMMNNQAPVISMTAASPSESLPNTSGAMSTVQQVAASSIPDVAAEDAAIEQWIATLTPANAAIMQAALPTMPQSDLDGMTDILINHWLKGDTNITPSELAFWNYFYPKYHLFGA